MTSPPVLVDVVCPACDGCGACVADAPIVTRSRVTCGLCKGAGEIAARLAEAVADTERPPPDDEETR